MMKRLIWNDIKQNKLSSAVTIFFMAVSAMLLSLTVLLGFSLLGTIDSLMEQYRQMRADVTDLADYVKETYSQTLGQLWLASKGNYSHRGGCNYPCGYAVYAAAGGEEPPYNFAA